MAVHRDVDGGTSGRRWRYVGTRPERAEAPSPGRALKKSPFLRTKTENAYDL